MRRYFLLACLVVFLVALGWSAPVTANGNVQAGGVRRDGAAIVAYWTPERMANARPAELVLQGEPSPARAPQPAGLARAMESGRGGAWRLVEVDTKTLMEEARLVEAPVGYTYPPPENTWPVPKTWYGSFPLRTVGKVFFTQNGSNFVASGAANGNRAVLTAGHVVSDGQENWSTNVVFVPALRESWRPYGTWTAIDLWTKSAWFHSQDTCRDVGYIIVGDQGGMTLAERVGSLGFSWNQSLPQAWMALGYPAASPWVGSIMVATNASYANSDSPGGCSPATVGIGTRQTPGASGGPWIRVYRAQQFGANNYANGVFSYYYDAYPNEIYSPYFDDGTRATMLNIPPGMPPLVARTRASRSWHISSGRIAHLR